MKDYIKIYLDKKFPNRIDVVKKNHPKLKGVLLELYKSGEKRLLVKISSPVGLSFHFYDAHPEDLQIWFQLSYEIAEQKLIDWVTQRLENQKSQGIYGV